MTDLPPILSPCGHDYSQPGAWYAEGSLRQPIGGWHDHDTWARRVQVAALTGAASLFDSVEAFDVAQTLISEGMALHGWSGEPQPRTFLDLSIDGLCRSLLFFLEQRQGLGPMEDLLAKNLRVWRAYFADLADGRCEREKAL